MNAKLGLGAWYNRQSVPPTSIKLVLHIAFFFPNSFSAAPSLLGSKNVSIPIFVIRPGLPDAISLNQYAARPIGQP